MSDDESPESMLVRLESLRRSMDLRLDENGLWWHEGRPFEHRRIIEAFDAGIGLHPDTGEPIVRVGERWCYFQVDDTPFFVRRLEVGPKGLTALLNNGERWPVPKDGFTTKNDRIYANLSPDRQAVLDRKTQLGIVELLSPEVEDLRIEIPAGVWEIRATPSK